MTEQERKCMLNIADTLKGEINRMCVTKDLSELDRMHLYARVNLNKLHAMKHRDLVPERMEDGEALHPGRMA